MPLYDYQCRACQKVTEVRHGFDETFDGRCPACGGEMRRVFNAAGIVFKGSGFYINDSRKGGAEGSSGGSKSSSSKSSESKSETPSSGGDSSATKSEAPAKSDSPSTASGDSSKSGAAA